MRKRHSINNTDIPALGLVVCLVALLSLLPACSFIEGLIGDDEGDGEQGDGAATAVPQPPVVPAPDAAVAAAMQKLPPGVDPSKLPPGFDPSKLPPGVDPSKLPPGVDPSKLPEGFDPSKIPDGGLPEGIDPSKLPPGVDPSKLPEGFDPSKLPEGFDPSKIPDGGLPEGMDPSKMAPGLSSAPPELRSKLVEAVTARRRLQGQIRRLNYVIDRNLTKNPADVVRLNRYVRARRELDSRMEAMRQEHNIPREVFREMVSQAEAQASSSGGDDDDE